MSPTSGDEDPAKTLKPALKSDSDAKASNDTAPKAVQIAEPQTGTAIEGERARSNSSASIKRFNAGVASKRLSGRMSTSSLSSKTTLLSQGGEEPSASQSQPEPSHGGTKQVQQRHRHHVTERLLAQVGEWLEHERKKSDHKKKHWIHRRWHKDHESSSAESSKATADLGATLSQYRHRSDSIDSESSEVSLDRLQRILEDNMAVLGLANMPHPSPRLSQRRSLTHLHRHSARQLLQQRTASSDTDYLDGDVVVPSCDAVLDNSKTMSYSGGFASTDDLPTLVSKREEKNRNAWLVFKNEIIRLAHTLRLKGWRLVPLEGGDSISVERLSGALTNAVYVVTPPPLEELSLAQEAAAAGAAAAEGPASKKTPTKILLRIYGPHADNIIDREEELGVLKRLARKRIGPRLLGTFTNGRFEEYFNASPLKPHDLRDRDTSKQIAKRMRELHDGIELLREEREAGPQVFSTWVRWLDNVEKRVTRLDAMIASGDTEPKGSRDAWKANGYICGVEWPKFKGMVEKHREFVTAAYGGMDAIKEGLVFAHNDTQYGNILRVRPDDKKSPLLQPANKHKQLIVIDFEYAAANAPGLEFANHFTEWCYDYHDAAAPHHCHQGRFPSVEEQRRFIRSYLDHRPQFPHAPGGSTPRLAAVDESSSSSSPTAAAAAASAAGAGAGTGAASGGSAALLPPATPPTLQPTASSSSIVEFMLDARGSAYSNWREEEKEREERSEESVQKLLGEARLWRPAISAQWVSWGIIQAPWPGPDDNNNNNERVKEGEEADEAELEGDLEAEEFDYLCYAQQRAHLFWGDCVSLGLVKEEELPEQLRGLVKVLNR